MVPWWDAWAGPAEPARGGARISLCEGGNYGSGQPAGSSQVARRRDPYGSAKACRRCRQGVSPRTNPTWTPHRTQQQRCLGKALRGRTLCCGGWGIEIIDPVQTHRLIAFQCEAGGVQLKMMIPSAEYSSMSRQATNSVGW